MKKRRNIFKPISPKKVAALLSVSLVMLPLTACREKNVEKPRIEIEFCDTSDIKLDTYLNNYVEDYESGKIHNGTEIYNYNEENGEFVKAYKAEKDGVTYYNEDTKKIKFCKKGHIPFAP
ncbi:MAG: hypothetical protein J6J60_10275 [Clostridia bacterium]|nr:hypothetical protein [Clostridia bacterium]